MKRVATRIVVPAGGAYDFALNVRRPKALYVLRGDPDALLVRLSDATTKRGASRVRLDVLASGNWSDSDAERAFSAGIALGGLDDDPGDFATVVAGHPLLASLAERFPGIRLTRTPTVFASFVSSVLEQLVTWQEASLAIRRIWRRYGDPIASLQLRTPPIAARLASATPWELRPLGISQRKAATLLYGAKRATALEGLREHTIAEAMRRLRSLPGIGAWTTNVIAIHALGYADGVLVGDAGAPFVTTLALTGVAGGDVEMLRALAPFRPHRARVHRLLEVAQRVDGTLPNVPRRRLPRVDPHRREPWR